MTTAEFIQKWRATELKKRSASQEHFLDLCELLDIEKPASADPNDPRYTPSITFETFPFPKRPFRKGLSG
jgi:hypothetical protein